MEGLGTGEFIWGFNYISYHFLSSCRQLDNITGLFLLQTSLSFAPGRPSITWSCMSWPSTASSEPSRIPLQSPEDYRPCTSNHLPPAPCPSFTWNSSKQTTTMKLWQTKKMENKCSQKNVSGLFYWILLLVLQFTHDICSLGSVHLIHITSLDLHFTL